MRKEFIPRPGAFGTHPVVFAKDIQNLTANVTNTVSFGGINRQAFIERLSVSCRTVPVDSDGTILATVKKRDVSAASNISLTAAFDLEALVANASSAIPLVAGLTDDQLTLDLGDTLFVDIVSNSAAIDTQAADLRFTAILGLLR